MNAFLSGGWRLVGLVAICLTFSQCAHDPTIVNEKDGSVMILIQEGEFERGGKLADLKDRPDIIRYLNYEGERPVRQIAISAFYIDKHEITNAQYRRFLKAVENSGDTSMRHPDHPVGVDHRQSHVDDSYLSDDQPVVGINWFDAYAYCTWAGKRLLTEAEWEYAARGNKGYRKYPWGDEAPDVDGIWRANYAPPAGQQLDGYQVTAPVGSFPSGTSPFGVMDMAGNAEEWVQDWLDFSYYRYSEELKDPRGPAAGTYKVVKGGCYISDQDHIRIATRLWGLPYVKGPTLGIRCASDP